MAADNDHAPDEYHAIVTSMNMLRTSLNGFLSVRDHTARLAELEAEQARLAATVAAIQYLDGRAEEHREAVTDFLRLLDDLRTHPETTYRAAVNGLLGVHGGALEVAAALAEVAGWLADPQVTEMVPEDARRYDLARRTVEALGERADNMAAKLESELAAGYAEEHAEDGEKIS
jgi:hypothetical protein